MKNKWMIGSMVAFAASCSAPSVFNVTRVGEEPEEYLTRAVYVLPQTLLQVNVEFEKETYIPGPYRFFTEKYLGLKDFIKEPGFSYRILNVDVETFAEPDPEHFYSINLLKGTLEWERYLEMTSHGLILNPHQGTPKDYSSTSGEVLSQPMYFNDLPVKSNLVETTDTLYKTVITDSSYVRIPVITKQTEAKTLEQKAAAAAEFIIKIRRNRYKLLAGKFEVFPEGQALDISVREMDKLEREYLELFFGKRVKQQFHQRFVVLPAPSNAPQNITLARFSQVNGITSPDSSSDNEIVLTVEPVGKLELIADELQDDNAKNKNNTLYYRMPDIAKINISIMGDILYQGRMPVFQLGEIVGMPVAVK